MPPNTQRIYMQSPEARSVTFKFHQTQPWYCFSICTRALVSVAAAAKGLTKACRQRKQTWRQRGPSSECRWQADAQACSALPPESAAAKLSGCVRCPQASTAHLPRCSDQSIAPEPCGSAVRSPSLPLVPVATDLCFPPHARLADSTVWVRCLQHLIAEGEDARLEANIW